MALLLISTIILLWANLSAAQKLQFIDYANKELWAQNCQELGGNATSFSKGKCCNPGTVSTPFYPALTEEVCPKGFYCSEIDSHSFATYPQFCPGAPYCTLMQLQGKFCPPQTKYQPLICPKGFYCPQEAVWNDSRGIQMYAKDPVICPRGYYCPVGQDAPIPCQALADCPEGSKAENYFGGLVLAGVVDFFFFAYMFILRWKIKTQKQKNATWAAACKKDTEDYESRTSPRKKTAMEFLNVSQGQESQPPLSPTSNGSNSGGPAPWITKLLKNFVDGRGPIKELSFEFQNLGLYIPEKVCNEPGGRSLLKNVNGKLQPGKVTAIMGPSGAGKTSFFTALMGKADKRHKLTGDLTINGVATEATKYKSIIGYVPQEDTMMRELTVRDNVLHSARCRLPPSWSAADIDAHVDNILQTLQLAHVAETPIGDENIRGISGGQRKRVNVAMELAAIPTALFLDEPTSGLDSTSALLLCSTLNILATETNLMVAMIIHQPRPEIFNALDELLLLAPGGLTVFQGPQALVKQYFVEVLQMEISPSMHNIADVLLDGIAFNGPNYVEVWESMGKKWVSEHASHSSPRAYMGPLLSGSPSSRLSRGRLEVGDSKVTPTDGGPSSKAKSKSLLPPVTPPPRGASFLKQCYYCVGRSFKQQYYYKMDSFLFEITLAAFASLFVYKTAREYRATVLAPFILFSPAPDYGAIVMMGLTLGFFVGIAGASPAVKFFTEEQVVYWREAASGHNRVAYYVAKNVSALPRMIIASVNFSALYIYLAAPVLDFFAFWLLCLLMWYCVYGLATMVSLCVKKEDATLFATIMVIFAAIFNSTASFPKYLVHTSYMYYATEAINAIMEDVFKNIYDIQGAAEVVGFITNRYTYDAVLMLVIGVIYRVVGLAGMILRNRSKQT